MTAWTRWVTRWVGWPCGVIQINIRSSQHVCNAGCKGCTYKLSKQYFYPYLYSLFVLTNLISKFVVESNVGAPVPPYLRGFSTTLWDEIYETALGRRPGYSKGLSWGLKLKSRKMASASSTSTSWSQSTSELQLGVELDEVKRVIEEQRKTSGIFSFTSGTNAKARIRHKLATTRTDPLRYIYMFPLFLSSWNYIIQWWYAYVLNLDIFASL